MYLAALLILLTGAYPLARAWLANRRTTLAHGLTWAALAWLAWLGVALAWAGGAGVPAAGRYVAVCLTGCAGVAVLGARRPGAGAWNFVVLGLLVISLLPLAEGFGRLHLTPPRVLFLAAILGVGLLNYLPTRLVFTAALLAIGCGTELASLSADPGRTAGGWEMVAVGSAPWAALVMLVWGQAPAKSEFDRTWLRFRDGFGALWGQRMREQFNRAAANAGCAGRLGWGGLRGAPPAEEEQLLATLRSLLKRFGPAE
jgi:hypothetical protein